MCVILYNSAKDYTGNNYYNSNRHFYSAVYLEILFRGAFIITPRFSLAAITALTFYHLEFVK